MKKCDRDWLLERYNTMLKAVKDLGDYVYDGDLEDTELDYITNAMHDQLARLRNMILQNCGK